MSFEEELSKGNFLISHCPKCEFVVWPPNQICSRCFGTVEWEKGSEFGKLIEFSQEGEKFFCLAEFDKQVRIMGILLSTNHPQIGQKIKLAKSNLHNGNYHFEMSLC